jgi:methyl-accepting chemotaxis protein/methyl-accepting chemotaxis protein-1 (serine sensor receptor)
VALTQAGSEIFIQQGLGTELNTALSQTAVKLDRAGEVQTKMWAAEAAKRGTFLAATLGQTEQLAQFERELFERTKGVRQSLAEIKPLLTTDQGRQTVEGMEAVLNEYEPLVREFVQASKDGKRAEVEPLVKRIVPLVDRFDAAGETLAEQQRQFLSASIQRATAAQEQGMYLTLVMLAMLASAGIAVVWTVRKANSSIERRVRELAEGSRQVASAAMQVSSASHSLSQLATDEAASIEEMSASSHEVQAMTRQNSEHAQGAAERTGQAAESIGKANEALAEMVLSMNSIVDSSSKISKIIKVIDEIAFQTNILALNAAVEAARAGEAGMGFAVVADEVRNLAQRSAQAARDTTGLIEESIGLSQQGKATLERVAAAIQSVTTDANEVRRLAGEVNASSAEQSRGIEQIAAALGSMERATQQVAAN